MSLERIEGLAWVLLWRSSSLTWKVPMQFRRLVTALGVLGAFTCFVETAAAQTAAAVASSGPVSSEPAVPDEPMVTPRLVVEDPRREVPQQRLPHRTLLVTGLVVLAGGYGASAIVAAKSDRSADEKLFVPVAGPWLDLKSRDCGVNVCDKEGLHKALLIGDGVVQGLGALSMLLSLVIPEPRERPWYVVGSPRLYVAPQVGRTNGLSAVGQF